MNDFTASAESVNDTESVSDTESANDSGPRPQAPAGAVGARPPLRRAYHGRMLCGVAAGIADYIGVDRTIIRVAFAVLTLAGGVGIPAYVACLFLIPEEGTDVCLASSLLDSVQPR
jgi:phage shock protein PspC (stress-responsive transcriptional regulator)